MSNAYQRAQNDMKIFSQQTVTVGDLFIGAIIPGIMICLGYLIYTIYKNHKNLNLKDYSNKASIKKTELLKTLALPVVLIFPCSWIYICWNCNPYRSFCNWSFWSSYDCRCKWKNKF